MDARLLNRLLDARTARQAALDEKLTQLITRRLRAMPRAAWYSDAQVEELATVIGQYVATTSAHSAALTDAFLAQALAVIEEGTTARPAGAISTSTSLRRGVGSHAEVYARLGETYRYHESIGRSPEEALLAVIARGGAMALMDLALARREQARTTLGTSDLVIGQRRILRPYLSKGGACGLCVVASDRMYFVDELMPVHDRCKCDVLPVTRSHDPGVSVNDADLGRLYDEAGSTYGKDLKQVRVRYENHGELGPVLVDARHRSKTPGTGREALAA